MTYQKRRGEQVYYSYINIVQAWMSAKYRQKKENGDTILLIQVRKVSESIYFKCIGKPKQADPSTSGMGNKWILQLQV